MDYATREAPTFEIPWIIISEPTGFTGCFQRNFNVRLTCFESQLKIAPPYMDRCSSLMTLTAARSTPPSARSRLVFNCFWNQNIFFMSFRTQCLSFGWEVFAPHPPWTPFINCARTWAKWSIPIASPNQQNWNQPNHPSGKASVWRSLRMAPSLDWVGSWKFYNLNG